MALPLIPIAAAIIGGGAGAGLVSLFGKQPQPNQQTDISYQYEIDRSVRTLSSNVYSPTTSTQYTRTSQITNAPVYTYAPLIQISSPYATGSLRTDIGSAPAGTAQSIPSVQQTPSVSVPFTETREGGIVKEGQTQSPMNIGGDMGTIILMGGLAVAAYLFLNKGN